MRIPVLYLCVWVVVRFITRMFFRIEVSGEENIPPKGAFILASNHRSYYDPVLINTWLPRPAYSFAKAELFQKPLFGRILRRILAFPVRRGTVDRKALARAKEVLRQGHTLVMFPEGTRCRSGGFLPVKPGIGLVAAAVCCPIVPTYLHGSDRLKDCLVDKTRLSISFGEPIVTTSMNDTKEEYLAIAQEVMSRIQSLSESLAATNRTSNRH